MANFQVLVVRIADVLPHPNAERLVLPKIQGMDVSLVSGAGNFSPGDKAVYIPDESVLPSELITELGLEGRLSGPEKNRLKATKLRGILSQGMLAPARPEWEVGQDVQHELGVKKYVAQIPVSMQGEVDSGFRDVTLGYDIENYRKFPHVLTEGEEIVMTEKIHGTFAQVSVFGDNQWGAASKGLGAQGLIFKPHVRNVYMRAAIGLDLPTHMRLARQFLGLDGAPMIMCGEVFGRGVQDLHYGVDPSRDTPGFRAFDVWTGVREEGRFLDHDELEAFFRVSTIPRVPILFRGKWDPAMAMELARGKETLSGMELHVREGIVVRPVRERQHEDLGRVQLKVVSEDYLTRHGGTEHN